MLLILVRKLKVIYRYIENNWTLVILLSHTTGCHTQTIPVSVVIKSVI